MNGLHAGLMIALCALLTFLIRLSPFVLFGGKKEVPPAVRYLGGVLPQAVMAALVVFCLKDIRFSDPGGFLPEALAVCVTAGVHVWKRNNIVSIAAGTLAYILLVRFVFAA